jgi:hypothetical protein
MRGISETEPEMQTFEIFIPEKLLNHYKADFLKTIEQEI